MRRVATTMATTIPAMAPPVMDLDAVDFEVAELRLVAVLGVTATVVVEMEVEVGVDEGVCKGLSVPFGGKYARPRFQRTACKATDCNKSSDRLDVALERLGAKVQ